jgi:hypothetical protein
VHTEDTVLIHPPLRLVYDLDAAVERWHVVLSHYRYVRVREARGEARLVEMAARRGRIPVWRMAVQGRDPAAPRARFRHVRGITAGMAVQWSFAPGPAGRA